MDYIQVLSDLIAMDTSVPPGDNYMRAVHYLIPLFQDAGFETQEVEIPPAEAEGRFGRVNLLCHRRYPGRHRLVFYCHIDVVPAQGWPAFQARRQDGKIFGRGSADMKGSVCSLLMAAERCLDLPLAYDTSIMITTDEEYSQASQLRYLSQFLQPLKGSYVFDLDSSAGFVSIANLGTLQLDIKLRGKSVHSGLSHMGENAVEKAIPLLNALVDLKSRVVERRSAIPAAPPTGLDRMVPRLNINMVHGGLKANIIPDECIIAVDRRLVPEEDLDEARREIYAALNSVPGTQWEIAREFAIPTLPPCDDPVTDALAGIIRDVTGQGGKYGEMGSGDLSNIVVNEWGGCAFGLGVIRPESNIHGINEFVYEQDIIDLADVIFRFMTGETSSRR